MSQPPFTLPCAASQAVVFGMACYDGAVFVLGQPDLVLTLLRFLSS